MKATPYRPSNGTEGDCFMAKFCDRCERDRNSSCGIVAATMWLSEDDPGYPAEWVTDEHGPRCTAFTPEGSPLPAPRCDKTIDMFQEPTA